MPTSYWHWNDGETGEKLLSLATYFLFGSRDKNKGERAKVVVYWELNTGRLLCICHLPYTVVSVIITVPFYRWGS